MALGASGSPKLTRKVAEAMAQEMKELTGINWCYGPVGDVNTNPQNPVIGESGVLD
jgi:beta-glucosidase-like glycosyl hydrolase